MAVIGIGVDVVHIPRIARAWLRYQKRFTQKFLHRSERAELDAMLSTTEDRRVQFLAARWAVKEAAFKALGPCKPRANFTDMQLCKDSGAPKLVFDGPLKQAAQDQGVCKTFVSLSHDGDYAFAQVLLEGK